ncbi:hypothetical protein FDG96_gp59 [Bacillus phage Mgbh1]|uniref:Uncharacterized protein n=1 Tax=Bacillus phage Mgbh1 TaxID=1796993 RepID=A0A142F1R1_9CAUD|nr:hypothetical protein FDG96_gp59 [Bacillus phage Mgbh1]AMQ66718.1 hypothetical protein [Bacillus phage Mgbh1]
MAELNVKVIDMKDGEVTKISYEGAEYERVDGEEKKGDIALVLEAWGSQDIGEYYRVNREDNRTYHETGSEGFVYIEGKYTDANCYRERVQLFRKVEEPLKVGDVVRVLVSDNGFASKGDIAVITLDDGLKHPYRLESLEGEYLGLQDADSLEKLSDEEVAEAKRKLDPRSKFEKGDKVRLISGGGKSPLLGFHEGKTYEVVDPYCVFHNGERILITCNRGGMGYALPEQLEKVTMPEFKVGDYAKVVGETRYGDIETGEIVKISGITDHIEQGCRIELLDGRDCDFVNPEDIEKVSEEVVKWAEIGRDPGEYKEGDIVRVIDTGSSDLTKGEVDEIVRVDQDGTYRIGRRVHANWVWRDRIELVTPVERRFDR